MNDATRGSAGTRDGDPRTVIILGAAGRDFHDFNVVYRADPRYRVVAFTAAQIPDIDGRRYPAELAGPLYPDGIPIVAEGELERTIEEAGGVDEIVFAYSDVSHLHVMHEGSRALAAGADYVLLGPRRTMLASTRPVVAIGAVRTGSGKSQTTRHVATVLKELGQRVVVVRHPMPYGDLRAQVRQRYASYADLERNDATIEEREEYEPHLERGHVVYAGIDYEQILRSAEAEADVVLWDGGNNDFPFFRPDLFVVVVDPLRAGHETAYHPGETNLRMADVLLINKVDSATPEQVAEVEASIARLNPRAKVIHARSAVTVDQPEMVRGKRAVVVEDGPTLTHGEMSYGAGAVAARLFGASEIVDPRPYAVGSIRDTFEKWQQLDRVIPAMGYGERQVAELEQTINAVPADIVLVGTPVDLGRVMTLDKPALRVRYELEEIGEPNLRTILTEFVAQRIPA
jgi:predicted GTPase